MAKKSKNGRVVGVMEYDKDSRKGTFHRYQIAGEVDGKQIVGTVYIPKGTSNKVKELLLRKEK